MNKKLKSILCLGFSIAFITSISSKKVLAYNGDENLNSNYTNHMKQNVKNRINSLKLKKNNILNDGFLVVLDPGHGGKDSGAVNKELSLYEKNLNLDIAKAVKARLESYNINVVMTREKDEFIELLERPNFANELGADMLVSLHNDTPTGNGDGAHIIHSVYDRNGGISKTLATNIGNNIKNKTVQNLKKNSPIWSRYSSDNPGKDYYAVIRESKMPAVIVEHAFMNNIDIQAINTLEKRITMGNAVADGIYDTIKNNYIGWIKVKDIWKFYDQNHNKQIGWEKINNIWYYFDEKGEMQTGWVKVDGKWYYLNNSGQMQTGWVKVDGKWYYLNNSGQMQTGWVKVDGKWYYLNGAGEMQTGWVKVNGKWYYLNGAGEMQTGWVKVNGKWYYLNELGEMQTGWLEINNKKYYLNGSGEMQIGTIAINNKLYTFANDGSLIE